MHNRNNIGSILCTLQVFIFAFILSRLLYVIYILNKHQRYVYKFCDM